MESCPHALLTHPDLGVRPPGQPLPAPLAGQPGPLADQFSRWLRQRDDLRQAAEKQAVTQALRAVSGDAVHREASRQAELALREGWDHWIWAVPAATVAALFGMTIRTAEDQRSLVGSLRAMAAGLAAEAAPMAVRQADEACLLLLDKLRRAEATAPDAPLQWAWLHHAGAAVWPDRATDEANRLSLLWQSHEAGSALLSHGLWHLVRDGRAPDRTALREIAREGGGVRLTRRFLQRDAQVQGQARRAGEAFTVALSGTPHAFGDGPHRCPGQDMALGTIEAALAYAAAQTRLPLPPLPRPYALSNMTILLADAPAPLPEVQP